MNLVSIFKKPKYVIMKGAHVGNRALLFMGANPKYKVDDYGNTLISFSNTGDDWYYESRIYIKIYTRRKLIKWRRLLGKNKRTVLERRIGKWCEIISPPPHRH